MIIFEGQRGPQALAAGTGNMPSFKHEMLREIYEQPAALRRTLALYLAGKGLKPEVAGMLAGWPNPAGEILIAASGSTSVAPP